MVRAELGPGRLGPAGLRAFRAAHRRLAPVQRQGRRLVQAADPHGRPHRCHQRAASVLHLLRHGVGLGLPVRRGARGRQRRLDHAAGGQRPHRHRHRPELPGGLDELHPFLDHYQGEDCSPTGTTGNWNAATGTSAGSEEWVIDLTPYAGKQVELSISYVSDWATQGLGVFLDDVSVAADGARSLRPRSRPTSAAGRWPGLRRVPRRTSTTGRAASSPTRRVRSRLRRTRSTPASGSRGFRRTERADFVTRSMQHLLGGAAVGAANPASRR